MKSKTLYSILALVCMFFLQTATMHAQESKKFTDNAFVSVDFTAGFKSHNNIPWSVGAEFSYNVVAGLSVLARYEEAFAMNTSTDTYKYSNLLGGGLSYDFFHGLKPEANGSRDKFSLKVYGGSSLGGGSKVWKQNFVSAGLEYEFKPKPQSVYPYLGIGYRYSKSKDYYNGMPNMHIAAVTLGFRF